MIAGQLPSATRARQRRHTLRAPIGCKVAVYNVMVPTAKSMDFPVSLWIVAAGVLGASVLVLPVRLWLSWVERNAKRESLANVLSLGSLVAVFYLFLCWAAFIYAKVIAYVREQQNPDATFMSYVAAFVFGVAAPVLVHALILYGTDDREPRSWKHDGGGPVAVFDENQMMLGSQHAVIHTFLGVPLLIVVYSVYCFFPHTPWVVAGWILGSSPAFAFSTPADASTVAFYNSESWWSLTFLGTYAIGFGRVIAQRASSPEAAVGLRPHAGFAMLTAAYGVALVIGVYIFAANGWQGGGTAVIGGWIFSAVLARLRNFFYFYLEA